MADSSLFSLRRTRQPSTLRDPKTGAFYLWTLRGWKLLGMVGKG